MNVLIYAEKYLAKRHFGLKTIIASIYWDTSVRGYSFFLSNLTKQDTLSHLLKRCHPAKDETPEVIAKLLKETDISDSRLAEAVMYAPQWADFAEQILGWKGLKCVPDGKVVIRRHPIPYSLKD